MEEMKTGAELEKQILEDARGKARRVLESADKECSGIRAEWEKKGKDEIGRMDADCGLRIARMREELDAALPLDFKRARLSFIEAALNARLDEVFGSLSKTEALTILGALVARVSSLFEGKKVIVYTDGLSAPEVQKVLMEGITGVSILDMRPMKEAALRHGAARRRATGRGTRDPSENHEISGFVLESEDGKIRFRGTFLELRETLMEEYREELATTLFGKDV
jgi:vacuolar-type H+-ATPase subunit E/Vma4